MLMSVCQWSVNDGGQIIGVARLRHLACGAVAMLLGDLAVRVSTSYLPYLIAKLGCIIFTIHCVHDFYFCSCKLCFPIECNVPLWLAQTP